MIDVKQKFIDAFDLAVYRRKGIYFSRKGGVVHADTSFAWMTVHRLEGLPEVVRFRHHNIAFDFIHPALEMHCASHIHFDVELRDNSRTLIYVTSEKYINNTVESAQIKAAERKAIELEASFQVWTEPILFGTNPDYMKSVIDYLMTERWRAEDDYDPLSD